MIADISNLDAPQTGREHRREVGKAGRTVKVWLVDDSETVRQLVREFLGAQPGLACGEEFGDPPAVLAALSSQEAPDVILLDIHMGAANGLDAIAPIRRRAPETRILMFTTFYDRLSEARALKAGALGFLLKSQSLEEVARKIIWAVAQPLPAPARDDSSGESNENRKEVRRAAARAVGSGSRESRGGRFFQGVRALVLGRAQAALDG